MLKFEVHVINILFFISSDTLPGSLRTKKQNTTITKYKFEGIVQ